MFVTKQQQGPLPRDEKPEVVTKSLPPLAPPYVSSAYFGDPAFDPPSVPPTKTGLNLFPGWRNGNLGNDEFLVDL